jgi:hypothetical protein
MAKGRRPHVGVKRTLTLERRVARRVALSLRAVRRTVRRSGSSLGRVRRARPTDTPTVRTERRRPDHRWAIGACVAAIDGHQTVLASCLTPLVEHRGAIGSAHESSRQRPIAFTVPRAGRPARTAGRTVCTDASSRPTSRGTVQTDRVSGGIARRAVARNARVAGPAWPTSTRCAQCRARAWPRESAESNRVATSR